MFKVSNQLDNLEGIRDQLRKNQFFHQDFKPQLGNSESTALYSELYEPNQNYCNYSSVYDYFNNNRNKIAVNLKKSRKVKLVDAKEVFGKKKDSSRETSEQSRFKAKEQIKDSVNEYLSMEKLKNNPRFIMSQLEEEVHAVNEEGKDVQTNISKSINDKHKRDQINKSIDIMKKKFEAKSNLDILRYFDRLGIDLIINNQTLYEQFCQRVNETMNEKKKYYQPSEQLIQMFKQELERKKSWRQVKQVRRESKISIPSSKNLERVSFITQNADSIFGQNKSFEKQTPCNDYKANSQLRAIEEIFSPKRKLRIKNFIEMNKSSIISEQSTNQNSKILTQRKHLRTGSQVIENKKSMFNRQSVNPSPNRFSNIYEFFNKSRIEQCDYQLYKNKRQSNSQVMDNFSKIIDNCTKFSTQLKESNIVSNINSTAKKLNDQNSQMIEGLDKIIINHQGLDNDFRDIKVIINENEQQKKEDIENYLNPQIISSLQKRSKETALYLSQVGEKKIWKPDKLVFSRKNKFANDLNDLLEGRN